MGVNRDGAFAEYLCIPASNCIPISPDLDEEVVAFFDAAGVARDGRPYANTYAWFLRMQDGRIIEAQAFFDALTFDDFWRRVPPAETK